MLMDTCSLFWVKWLDESDGRCAPWVNYLNKLPTLDCTRTQWIATRWLLITQHWPHYSCLWKETSISRPWFTCQSQAKHLIKTTIGKDEDAVYTSSDRMGQASPTSHKSPQPWWLRRMESGQKEVRGQQSCLWPPLKPVHPLPCLLCGQRKPDTPHCLDSHWQPGCGVW